MLHPTQILDSYAWLYSSLTVPPDAFDHVILTDGGMNGIKVEPDGTCGVYIHGSEDIADWQQDFHQVAIPVDHPKLGLVHPGFLAGANIIKPEIDAYVGDRPVAYYGHSYGAGRAAILAGLRITEGKPVARVVLFGEPRAGGPILTRVCGNIAIESYRNAKPDGGPMDHDLVTDVPFNLGPQAPYQPLRGPLTDVWCEPRADDAWAFFRFHHLYLYCKAFGCGGPAPISLYAAAGVI